MKRLSHQRSDKVTKEGTRPGYNIQDITKIERLEGGRIIQCITEESLSPKIVDKDHEFLCGICESYINALPDGSGYVCKNNRCTNYLITITQDMLLSKKQSAMKLPNMLDPQGEDEMFFASWNPDKSSDSGNLKVTWQDKTGRIKHLKYKNFPKDLSLEANS